MPFPFFDRELRTGLLFYCWRLHCLFFSWLVVSGLHGVPILQKHISSILCSSATPALQGLCFQKTLEPWSQARAPARYVHLASVLIILKSSPPSTSLLIHMRTQQNHTMHHLTEQTLTTTFDQLVDQGVIVYGPHESVKVEAEGYPVG